MRKTLMCILLCSLMLMCLPVCAFADHGTNLTIIIPEADYNVIEGEGGEYDGATARSLRFRSDGDYGRFRYAAVDGGRLSKKDYDAWEGSTYVELRAEYLSTLAEGRHTLTFVFRDGECSTWFYIKNPAAYDPVPKTGDESHKALWLALAVISLGGLAAVSAQRLRKGGDEL